ncbi:hypothetical protein CC2G_002621 [Coprinopsis cinerea AmutBmut pab1-1]|nr:hypothetical protein CC2G_002621 [Coprinopsis cinerea AmutBmut pab1-1]
MASPAVSSTQAAVAAVQKYLSPLLEQLSKVSALFNFNPAMVKLLKAVVFVVFVLNIRSWPLVWHVRIWRWAILKRLDYRLFRIRTVLHSKEKRGRLEDKWVENSIALGARPFKYTSSYHTYASLDESDFNMHLSNSSYAKTLDSARFKLAVEMFTPFFRGGGWIPLAATQYHFICEIPILASYEVRTSLGAWDGKWFYLVSKFVMPANKSKKKRKSRPAAANGNGNPDSMASLRTPSCEDDVSSGTSTPVSGSSATPNPVGANGLAAQLLKAKAESANGNANGTATPSSKRPEHDHLDIEEPDGAQVHTVAISRCCFKVGRITVPPALVFALCGMSSEGAAASSSSVVSAKNFKPSLPPHWTAVRATCSPFNASAKGKGRAKVGGYGTFDPRVISRFLKGGWKEVEDPKDKWWERAFDSVREENEARLRKLEGRA